MKILFISYLLFISLNVLCQKNEISVHYRHGFPLGNNRILAPSGLTRLDYRDVQTYYDNGVILSYQHSIWNKLKLYFNSGIEYSNSKHAQKIIESKSNYHLGNIIINNQRLVLHIGLIKKINLFNDKASLNFGYDLTYRHTLYNNKKYSEDFQFNNEDWIEYKYELNTYYNKYYESAKSNINPPLLGFYLPSEWKINFKSLLTKNLSLDIGFSYTRKNFFYFHYTNTIRYYINDSPIPTETYKYLGLMGSTEYKTAVVNDYFYLNLGLTFTL